MGVVVDLTKRIRSNHRPTLVGDPSGRIFVSGMPMARVCANCKMSWPCAAIRHLTDNT